MSPAPEDQPVSTFEAARRHNQQDGEKHSRNSRRLWRFQIRVSERSILHRGLLLQFKARGAASRQRKRRGWRETAGMQTRQIDRGSAIII
jgi:hypothetical protein